MAESFLDLSFRKVLCGFASALILSSVTSHEAPASGQPMTNRQKPLGYVYAASSRIYLGSNPPPGIISQYQVMPDGRLVPLSPPTVNAGSNPRYVDIAPDGHFAYVVNEGEATVSQYRINRDGTLSALNPPSVPVGVGWNRHVWFSQNGQFAYVGNEGDSSVSEFHIEPDGTLEFGSPIRASSYPFTEIAAMGNNFIYPGSYFDSHIFPIMVSGKKGLASLPQFRENTKDWYIISDIHIDSKGRFAYVCSQTAGSRKTYVGAYHAQKDGSLRLVDQKAIWPCAHGQILEFHHRFLYVIDDTFDGSSSEASGIPRIYQYRICKEGRLQPMYPNYITLPAMGRLYWVANFVLDHKYLYIPVGGFKGAAGVYELFIGGDGRLRYLSSQFFAIDENPMSILVVPKSKYVYVGATDRQTFLFSVGKHGQLRPLNPPAITVPVDAPHNMAYVSIDRLSGKR